MSEPAEPGGPRATDGRIPGARGLATRARLLEATVARLQRVPYRELAVVDIAREAATSPATFYQYFDGVEAAALALAEEVTVDGSERLVPLVRGRPWVGPDGWASAGAVVDGFLSFWEDHRAVLRVMDLGTDEGDPRFGKLRSRLFVDFNDALAERVARAAEDVGRVDDVDPKATAGALTSMLAHVAAHAYGFESYGIRTADTREAMARILFTTVTGDPPPPATGRR